MRCLSLSLSLALRRLSSLLRQRHAAVVLPPRLFLRPFFGLADVVPTQSDGRGRGGDGAGRRGRLAAEIAKSEPFWACGKAPHTKSSLEIDSKVKDLDEKEGKRDPKGLSKSLWGSALGRPGTALVDVAGAHLEAVGVASAERHRGAGLSSFFDLFLLPATTLKAGEVLMVCRAVINVWSFHRT